MSNLSQLRARVDQRLADSVEKRWSSTALDEAIRTALELYTDMNPRRLITTTTLSSDSREVDLSAVSGLLLVRELWLPYTAANPEYPPNRRRFEHWVDSGVVRVVDEPGITNGEVARIFYEAVHTIEDLDGAAATSLISRDEGLIVIGAAAGAALARSAELMRGDKEARAQGVALSVWAEAMQRSFSARLGMMAERVALAGASHIELPPLDRWDSDSWGWS